MAAYFIVTENLKRGKCFGCLIFTIQMVPQKGSWEAKCSNIITSALPGMFLFSLLLQ